MINVALAAYSLLVSLFSWPYLTLLPQLLCRYYLKPVSQLCGALYGIRRTERRERQSQREDEAERQKSNKFFSECRSDR